MASQESSWTHVWGTRTRLTLGPVQDAGFCTSHEQTSGMTEVKVVWKLCDVYSAFTTQPHCEHGNECDDQLWYRVSAATTWKHS